VPLIGFAGAPWTLFCYMVQGEGSKNFDKAKSFLYQHPDASRHVMKELTKATIDYLKAQVDAGAQAVQLFDSWAGLLSPDDFNEWALPYLMEITQSIKEVPVILFAKGAWYALERLALKAVPLHWDSTGPYPRSLPVRRPGMRSPCRAILIPHICWHPSPRLKRRQNV
jgi:uroporphyrinogen decarboxylase